MALMAAAVGLGACDDDGGTKREDSSGGSPTTGRSSTGQIGERTITAKELFCEVMAQIDTPFTEAGQYASREQKIEAAKKIIDLLGGATRLAPSDIADAARTKLEAIRTAAGGEPSALIDSKTLDAAQKLNDYCPA